MTTAPSSPVKDTDPFPAASADLPQTSWRSQPTQSTSSDSSSGGQQPDPTTVAQPAKPVLQPATLLKPATLPPPAVKESPNASIPPPQRPPGYLITSTPRVPQPTAATGATPKQPRDETRFPSPILPPVPKPSSHRHRPPLPVTFPTRHPGIADKLPIGKRKRPPRVTPHTTFQEPPRSKPRQPKKVTRPTGPPPLTRAAAAAGNIVLPQPPYLGSTIERMLKKKFKTKDSDSSSSDTL